MNLELLRTYYPGGTNGELLLGGTKICNTIELPWKGNQRRISCIPEGKYRLQKRFSVRHGWHLSVMNVKGRDSILIHPANDAKKELLGCIAPVLQLTGKGKGSASRLACERLEKALFPLLEKGFVIELTIKKV
ncbi:hypothetical protein H0S70_01580 [Chryseobacterium manosquense]|uniref:DUF5675 domain-containing protein n=1 Tax=Chryseobacterium manosquense TaxID=2754694 RepID=A0A7H1DXK4_9FLAO|nr:DUF5675 family protein [Chryseobacterium manosquense]QNS41712.1 hypothetical protein H0S70_01580 [Chryseobacterium manosquense]